jgi:hypothetical protein
MYNVEVKRNFTEDELYCAVCKERILLTEKYLVIVDDILERTPVHFECVEETPEDDEIPFISPT